MTLHAFPYTRASRSRLVIALTVAVTGALLLTLVRFVEGWNAAEPGPATTAVSTAAGPLTLPPTPPSRVVLHAGGVRAVVVLDDTSAARQVLALLPLHLAVRDAMGQAKVARLRQPLDVTGAARSLRPARGGVYYWPPTGDLAVFYDDLGQTVPPPGLVPIGVVVENLAAITDTDDVTIQVD